MADNSEIEKKLESLKQNRGMNVPEGYFDNLPGKVMSKIKDAEITEPKKTLFKLIRPQLALVASFAALFLLAYTGFKLLIPAKSSQLIDNDEIMAVLHEEIYEVDEALLYNLAMGDNSEEETESPEMELSREDIINYLIEEGEDIDLLITGN